MAIPFQKDLSLSGLINAAYQEISKMGDPRQFRKDPTVSLFIQNGKFSFFGKKSEV